MNLGLLYYLVGLLDGVNTFLGVVCFFSGIIFLIFLVFYIIFQFNEDYEIDERQEKMSRKWTKIFLVVFLISCIHFFIPTKKEALIIAGLTMADSPLKKTAIELQDTFPDLVRLINKEIKEQLEEFSEKKSREDDK